MQEVNMTEGEKTFFTHYVEYIDMRLRRFFKKLLIIFALLGFTSAVAIYYIAKISAQNHEALCAQKFQAADQIKQTEDFIMEHPEGFAGVGPSVLRRGLIGPKRTVIALKDVNCER